MKPFTRLELLFITIILILIAIATYPNMELAVRRARDVQRREDLGRLDNALGSYHAQFNFYPPGQDGLIKACKGNNYDLVITELEKLEKFDKDLFFTGLAECFWGIDAFRNVTDLQQEAYLSTLPRDPGTKSGTEYLYLSDSRFFQVYAYLEGEKEEAGYNEAIVKRNLSCGNKICNFGKSSPGTPLDMSLEEYERILLEKNN